MKKLHLLFIFFLVLSCTNTPQNTLKFTKQEYTGEWPFSVDEIEVYCSGYKEIYCKTSNGKVYALNGSAKGASRKNSSISKIEEIWLDDPKWTGVKIPYTDFIKEGLKICENK